MCKPYPNRNITLAGTKYGRKICKQGIPLIFDSLDDLQKIDHVGIQWMVEDEKRIFILHLDYAVSFKQGLPDNRFFLLHTKDTFPFCYKNMADYGNYQLSRYDSLTIAMPNNVDRRLFTACWTEMGNHVNGLFSEYEDDNEFVQRELALVHSSLQPFLKTNKEVYVFHLEKELCIESA